MIKDFFGDHLTPLAWGERLPTVWEKPFTFSEQEWAGRVTDQQFIQNSAENLSGEYQKIGEIMRDTFVGLHDRMARFQGRTDDPVSTELFRHLSESDEWHSLKEKTRGDTMGSALATSHISKEFLANLPDEVKEAIKKHQEAQRELENAQAQANAGLPISSDQLDALRERMVQTQAQALSVMGNSPAQIKASAWDSAQAAQNELNQAKSAASAFGLGWGNESGDGVTMDNLDGIVELSKHISDHEEL